MNLLQLFIVVVMFAIPTMINARVTSCPSLSQCIDSSDIILTGKISATEDLDDKTGLAHITVEYIWKGSFGEKEITISHELFHSKFTCPGMYVIPKIKKNETYIIFIKERLPFRKKGPKYMLYDLEGGIIHKDQPVLIEIVTQLKKAKK